MDDCGVLNLTELCRDIELDLGLIGKSGVLAGGEVVPFLPPPQQWPQEDCRESDIMKGYFFWEGQNSKVYAFKTRAL